LVRAGGGGEGEEDEEELGVEVLGVFAAGVAAQPLAPFPTLHCSDGRVTVILTLATDKSDKSASLLTAVPPVSHSS
jgi:hypothetical protein